MKTLTLKEAYVKASVGPLKAVEEISTDQSHEFRHYIETDGADFPKARSVAIMAGGAHCQPEGEMAKFYKPEILAENRVNSALLTHAFNVLPEALEALERLVDRFDSLPLALKLRVATPFHVEIIDRARAAITKANSVSIP